MKINDRLKVGYLGDKDTFSFDAGKIYEGRVLQKNWYGIVDETREEYAYPPELFELVEYIGPPEEKD